MVVHRASIALKWSGREDSNLRPPGPEPGALPDCATPRTSGGKSQLSEAQDAIAPGVPLEPRRLPGRLIQSSRK